MQKNKPGKKIIGEEQLQLKIKELAKSISKDYQDKNPVLISILKSSIYFMADLSRQLTIPVNIEFLGISRLPDANNRGKIQITKDLDLSIRNRHVLIIDTIINTGLTHSYLIKNLNPRRPESLNICTLIENPDKRLVNLPINYSGFTFNDTNLFVVGYGLDYKEQYRHLPYIAKYNK